MKLVQFHLRLVNSESYTSINRRYQTRVRHEHPTTGERQPMNNTHLKSIICPRSLGKYHHLPHTEPRLITLVNNQYTSECVTESVTRI